MENLEIDRSGASAESSIETHVIEALSQRVFTKLLNGGISLHEAASRLVGCGRFDENSEASLHLEKEFFPRIELRLEELESEIAMRSSLARKLRAIISPETTGLLHASPEDDRNFESAQALQERSRKEKSRKKKTGDENTPTYSSTYTSTGASAPPGSTLGSSTSASFSAVPPLPTSEGWDSPGARSQFSESGDAGADHNLEFSSELNSDLNSEFTAEETPEESVEHATEGSAGK